MVKRFRNRKVSALLKTLLICGCVFSGLVTKAEEQIGRGMLAIPYDINKIFLGWRLLKNDDANVAFNVYRSSGGGTATKLNAEPIKASTCFIDDSNPPRNMVNSYWIKPVVNGQELTASEQTSVPSDWGTLPYISIPLYNTTEKANKVGIADLNGDKKYDFVIKWPNKNIDPYIEYYQPSPDTYKLHAYLDDGTFLWEYDLGWSIEMGIWYSPYIVYDFDGDGKAEVAVKTGEGDPRDPDGKVTSGPEYLSILDGMTGAVVTRTNWPSRDGFPSYNYYSRNQLGVAYLNGRNNNPSLIVVRGTYNLIKVMAYQYSNQTLSLQWSWTTTAGGGAHNMHCADVDGDGKDEIIVGTFALDDNGTELWRTGLGHCDHAYVGNIDPNHSGLEIYYGVERSQSQNGTCLVDAATGQIIWGLNETTYHVHSSGLCSDIDALSDGMECYSKERDYTTSWLHSAAGFLLDDENTLNWSNVHRAIYWDADPQRELLNPSSSAIISKYPAWNTPIGYIKGTQLAWADILGDWREEVITSMPGELRIYSTTIPARGSNICLMQDPIYRADVAHLAMGYSQPPMVNECLKLRLGLTGQWKFNEGTGTQAFDTSGQNTSVTVNGATWTTGISGNALYFDGVNDCVVLPSSVIALDEGSVEMWFKRKSIVPGVQNYILAHPETTNNSRIYFNYNPDSSLLMFRLGNGALIGSYTTELDKWYHVAGVWKGTTGWFYVNGELINPGGTTFNGLTSTTTVRVGCISGGIQSFNGVVDEVKIYNRALNAGEVKENYSQLTLNGQWKFDEGVGTKAVDSSGRGNDGTVTGATWNQGISGNALYFDGVDDCTVLPSSVIPLKEGSIQLWLNRKSIASGVANYVFAHPETTSNSRVYLSYNPDSSLLMFRLGNGTLIGSYTTELDKWYHITGVWKDTTGWFYVNGELINPGGTTFNGLTSTTTVRIGGLYIGGQPFNGVIDEVKIYNHALNSTEINDDYNRMVLASHWKFEEGTGTEAFDSSGKGNTGTIYGNATWQEGISGNALYFDGVDDYVNFPSSVIIPDEGSVELCFNRSSIVPDETNYIFAHPETMNNSRIYLNFNSNSSSLAFRLGDATTIGSYTTQIGEWYHVVGVWKGTTGWFYVNGELINPGGTTFNGLTSTTTVRVGCISGGVQSFNGIVDEVKIYNRALTAAEVEAKYSELFE